MFKINNEYWQIKRVPPDSYYLQRPDGTHTVGACDDKLKTIFISNAIYGDFYKKVLYHELTHAVMFAYDVTLTVDEEELVAEVVATFGKEIFDIVHDLGED